MSLLQISSPTRWRETCSSNQQVKFDSNGGDHLEPPESKINAWAQSVKALL